MFQALWTELKEQQGIWMKNRVKRFSRKMVSDLAKYDNYTLSNGAG
jgi:hypothetical protein